MKKYTILFTGLLAVILVGLMLGSTACKMPRWQYAGNMPPGKPTLAGEDLAYGYRLIQIGEPFPDTPLNAPPAPRDRAYLGLPSDGMFSVSDITADLVLVEMLNVHCEDCLNRLEAYNALFQDIEADPVTRDRVKMMAVGVGNTGGEIQRFSSEYHVRFPLVADPQFTLHAAVGKPVTPFSILVRLQKKPDAAVVALTAHGVDMDYAKLHQDMAALVTLDVSVLRERRSQALADRVTVAPPQSEKEITSRIRDAMMRIAGEGNDLADFRKLSIADRHVYAGVIKNGEGAQTLYAEVISRPTICEVCEDVHFFYVFNEKGAVVEFVPLQLTKWGNNEWTAEDIEIMRQRLMGRFIFTPFYFNPELDAVSSATITSAIIFDSLSDGKSLFDSLGKR